VIAVSPLKRRSRAFSERTLGRIGGGRNKTSTDGSMDATGVPIREALASRATNARCKANTMMRIVYREKSHALDSYMSKMDPHS